MIYQSFGTLGGPPWVRFFVCECLATLSTPLRTVKSVGGCLVLTLARVPRIQTVHVIVPGFDQYL
jgi:hypothetical protein